MTTILRRGCDVTTKYVIRKATNGGFVFLKNSTAVMLNTTPPRHTVRHAWTNKLDKAFAFPTRKAADMVAETMQRGVVKTARECEHDGGILPESSMSWMARHMGAPIKARRSGRPGLPADKYSQVVALLDAGIHTQGEIAKKVGISRNQVAHVKHKQAVTK